MPDRFSPQILIERSQTSDMVAGRHVRGTIIPRRRYAKGREGFLLLAILCVLLPISSRAEVLTLAGTGADLETMRVLGDAFARSHADVTVDVLPSLGSSGGVKAVLAGAIGLGLTSRPLKESERNAGARETAYAKSLTVFAVARKNPVTGFTTAELNEIYAGKRTTWADGTSIRLIMRPESDSDAIYVMQHVRGMGTSYRSAIRRKGVFVASSDQENADAIRRVPGSLGTTTLSVILLQESDPINPIKALSLDGVAPASRAVKDNTYTLARPLYFVTGPEVSELAREFMFFVHSTDGKAILERTGHVPIAP